MATKTGRPDTRFSKDIAEDLSLINGLPNKINLEYIRSVQQLIIYRICEQRLSGKKTISVEIPNIGLLTINFENVKSELDIKPNNLRYSFEPTKGFSEDVARAFNNDGFELPEMLANKYGQRILNKYSELLT